jgi:hypothetical protein
MKIELHYYTGSTEKISLTLHNVKYTELREYDEEAPIASPNLDIHFVTAQDLKNAINTLIDNTDSIMQVSAEEDKLSIWSGDWEFIHHTA